MVVIREQASDISKLYAVVDAPVDSQCRVRRHRLLPEYGEGLYKATAAVGGGTANLMADAILKMYVLQRGCDYVKRVCTSQPGVTPTPPTPWRRPASAASPGVRRLGVLTGNFSYTPLSARCILHDSADVHAETKVRCITFTRIYLYTFK